MKDKVKILDTEYSIQLLHEEDDPKLKECDGYTDFTSKKIVVCNRRSDDKMQVENPEIIIAKVARHEMVHAFLSESGLGVNSWADNEEVVDWIAIQFPKMREAFDKVFREETEDRDCCDCKYYDTDLREEPCKSCTGRYWHDKWEAKDNVSESD